MIQYIQVFYNYTRSHPSAAIRCSFPNSLYISLGTHTHKKSTCFLHASSAIFPLSCSQHRDTKNKWWDSTSFQKQGERSNSQGTEADCKPVCRKQILSADCHPPSSFSSPTHILFPPCKIISSYWLSYQLSFKSLQMSLHISQPK